VVSVWVYSEPPSDAPVVKNKAKILNDATKFLQKGAYDKAVRELQKLVEDDPKDVRTILKVGDILAKKGDKEDAIRSYRRVAELYGEQGFFLKAVAVYKQILKLDPQHFEVTLKLAELYEQLGLLQEALAQYTLIATLYEQRGDVEERLAILRRMVELDPENVASRVRLAEAFSRENRVVEAIEAFRGAANVLRAQGRQADYIKVAERLLFHDAEQHDVAQDLARLYLAQGDARRAVARLEPAYRAAPGDVATLSLLGRGFRDLGMLDRAVYIFQQLGETELRNGRRDAAQMAFHTALEIDPDHIPALEALGGVGARGPSSAAQRAAPARAAPARVEPARVEPARATVDASPRAPLGPRAANPRRSPSTTDGGPSQRPGPRASARGPSDSGHPGPGAPARAEPDDRTLRQQVAKLITETDVYVKYGLRDRALDHLRKILDLDPDSVEAHEKMRDLYIAARDRAHAAESIAALMRIAWRGGDDARVDELRKALTELVPGHPMAQAHADLSAAGRVDEGGGVDSIDIDVSVGDFDEHPRSDRASIPVSFGLEAEAHEHDDVGDHDILSAHDSQSGQTGHFDLPGHDDSGFVGVGTEVDAHVAFQIPFAVRGTRPSAGLGGARTVEPGRARPTLEDEPLGGGRARPSAQRGLAARVSGLSSFDAAFTDDEPFVAGAEPSPPPALDARRFATDAAPAEDEGVAPLPLEALGDHPGDGHDDLLGDDALAAGDAELLSLLEGHGGSGPPALDELEADLENVEFLEAQGLLDEARDSTLELLKRDPLNARAVQLLDRIETAMGLRSGGDATDATDAGEALDALSDLGGEVRAVAEFDAQPRRLPDPTARGGARDVEPSADDDAPLALLDDAGAESAELDAQALAVPELAAPSDVPTSQPMGSQPMGAQGEAFTAPPVESERVPALDDATAEQQLHLGHAYVSRGLYAEGISALELAATNARAALAAFDLLGQTLKATGDLVGAVNAFYRTLELGPPPERAVQLKLEIALACEGSGDGESAVQWYGSALADDPAREDIRVRILELGGDPSAFVASAPGLGVELAGEIQLYAGDPAGDLQALPELRAGSALDAGTLEGAAEVPGEGTGPSLTASSRRNKISYV
jgi:pilus assembly protein FimV